MAHDHGDVGKRAGELGELKRLSGNRGARVGVYGGAVVATNLDQRMYDGIAEDEPLEVAVELQAFEPRIEAAAELFDRAVAEPRVDRGEAPQAVPVVRGGS